jgi:hypothetical protein
MSTKLVRKFSNIVTGGQEEKARSCQEEEKVLEEEQGTPATEQDVIDMHVKSLLALDRSIATQSRG